MKNNLFCSIFLVSLKLSAQVCHFEIDQVAKDIVKTDSIVAAEIFLYKNDELLFQYFGTNSTVHRGEVIEVKCFIDIPQSVTNEILYNLKWMFKYEIDTLNCKINNIINEEFIINNRLKAYIEFKENMRKSNCKVSLLEEKRNLDAIYNLAYLCLTGDEEALRLFINSKYTSKRNKKIYFEDFYKLKVLIYNYLQGSMNESLKTLYKLSIERALK